MRTIIFSSIVSLFPSLPNRLRSQGGLLYWHNGVLATILSVLLAVPQAYAKVYRIEHADGSVSYTDKAPIGNQGNVQEIELQQAQNVIDTSRSTRNIEAAAKAIDRQRDREKAIKAKRQAKVRVAIKSLNKAKDALALTKEPTEGDYISNAGGGTRLSQRYYARIAAAEKKVEQAQQALNTARRK